MKLSTYNLWVTDYPERGQNLLFNTRTQGLIKIDDEFKQKLDHLPSSKQEITDPQLLDSLGALKENGIIVESESHEEVLLDDFFRQLQYESHRMPFEVTILTTFDCNFGCVYCFEESVKEHVFMDEHTSALTVEWIIQRAKERGYHKVFAVYYGGEPLMNIRPIYEISWQLTQWAKEKGKEFAFGIITNGSLVTPDLIDKLLPVGLQEIRISIDGDRDHHNHNRPFRDGRESFDVIIDNIRRVIDKVNVGVTGNFAPGDVKSIGRLLDYLEKENLLHRLSRVDFSPIMPRLGKRSSPGRIELGSCLQFFEKDGIAQDVLAVKQELLKRNLPFDTGCAINSCALMMPDGAVAIDPNGLIYKCNSLVGYPEFSVGTIRENRFNGNFDTFIAHRPWEQCASDCPYVPMCQGGCRFFAYVEQQDFSRLACKRGYFDEIMPELIKLEYKKLLSPRGKVPAQI
ncbi:MAG: radical SAM protein [Candidatus Omnitrophica bacterium]|nr:radical SAM protein [Candidatus Omnitrophota bacterium]